MTIANKEQLRQAEAAVATLREGLVALRRDPRTTKAYALLAEGPLEQIRQIEEEIDGYVGADRPHAPAPARSQRGRGPSALGWSVALVACAVVVSLPFGLGAYRDHMADEEIRVTQELLYPIGPADGLGQELVAVRPYVEPEPVVEDVDAGPAVAPDAAERTCAAGNGGACYTLGVRAERAGDLDEARRSYARGCDAAGHSRCCYSAGRLAVRAAEDAAAEYFAPACRDGMVPACWQLARIEWRAGSSPELEEHLRTVCDSDVADNGDACDRLGILASRGARVDEAVRLFDRACTLDAAGGCANLAHHVYNGIGIARDRSRGLELYARGCDGGVPSSCVAELAVRRARADQFGDAAREAVARETCLRFGGDPSLCGASDAR